jgi:hypothetical protein
MASTKRERMEGLLCKPPLESLGIFANRGSKRRAVALHFVSDRFRAGSEVTLLVCVPICRTQRRLGPHNGP